MCALLIYADTTVWNALCDESVDAGSLTKELARQGGQLVLGTNAVYEMAKTFKGSRPIAKHRGKELFSYLRRYVQLGVPLLRETGDLLREEAKHVTQETKDLELFYGNADYKKLVTEVDKLAQGVFDSRADQFIPSRVAEAKQSRDELSTALDNQSYLKRRLSAIPEGSVDRWIARETKRAGRRILAGHLTHEIRGQPKRDLTWLAKRLLASPHYRVSHAMVRSDLYLNWRYCRRGSLGKDMPDDNYHAVNASHCDFFVTTDLGFAGYASHVLTHTKVELYAGGSPLANWLVSNCRQS